jgi:hypothetical protein
MELRICRLLVPAIGCRKLEPGRQIRVIVQKEMHQLQVVLEVEEDGVHHKQGLLRQEAGLCPGQVLHGNTEIALAAA